MHISFVIVTFWKDSFDRDQIRDDAEIIQCCGGLAMVNSQIPTQLLSRCPSLVGQSKKQDEKTHRSDEDKEIAHQ